MKKYLLLLLTVWPNLSGINDISVTSGTLSAMALKPILLLPFAHLESEHAQA